MRYLVKAKLKPGCEQALLSAINDGSLGEGSVAGDEYLRNMIQSRIDAEDQVCWVEVCYCSVPLNEESPYWEDYFELVSVKDAHARDNCRDLNGTEPRACCNCDCTALLEEKMESWGQSFLKMLRKPPTL